MELKRAEFIIHGRVQGVGFRYFVHNRANALNLKGIARNQWDGTVYVVAEGEMPALEMLRSSLERGPSLSRVANVEVDYKDSTGEFSSFEIL